VCVCVCVCVCAGLNLIHLTRTMRCSSCHLPEDRNSRNSRRPRLPRKGKLNWDPNVNYWILIICSYYRDEYLEKKNKTQDYQDNTNLLRMIYCRIINLYIDSYSSMK